MAIWGGVQGTEEPGPVILEALCVVLTRLWRITCEDRGWSRSHRGEVALAGERAVQRQAPVRRLSDHLTVGADRGPLHFKVRAAAFVGTQGLPQHPIRPATLAKQNPPHTQRERGGAVGICEAGRWSSLENDQVAGEVWGQIEAQGIPPRVSASGAFFLPQ